MTHEHPDGSPDSDLVPCTFVLGISPEEFEKLRGRFMVDLARLCSLPPDDIEITSVKKAQDGEL